MPEEDFRSLGERLLSAGIAPRHVRRLVTELASHYDLLVEEERAHGQVLEAARSMARNRLGTNDDIVRKVLEQRALKSWGARWPLSICGLAPMLGLAASAVATVAALVVAFDISRHLHAGPAAAGGIASVTRQGLELIGWWVMYALPVLWAWVLARYAVTRRLGRLWPVIGFVMTAALGAATNVRVSWPHPGVGGQLTGGVGFSTGWDALTRFGTRGLITFALALAAYYVMRQRVQTGQRA